MGFRVDTDKAQLRPTIFNLAHAFHFRKRLGFCSYRKHLNFRSQPVHYAVCITREVVTLFQAMFQALFHTQIAGDLHRILAFLLAPSRWAARTSLTFM